MEEELKQEEKKDGKGCGLSVEMVGGGPNLIDF